MSETDYLELAQTARDLFDECVRLRGELNEANRALKSAWEHAVPPGWDWPIGTRVRKKSGAQWQGSVCGYYSNRQTPFGYCVVSEREIGSTQIYPAAALELVVEKETADDR